MNSKRDHVIQLLTAHFPAAGHEAEAVRRCVAMVDEAYKQVPLRTPTARTSKVTAALAPEFDTFWAKYPKNGGSKKVARKAWTGAAALADTGIILAGLDRYLRSKHWTMCLAKGESNYIPHASTWLNQCRWENEPEAAPGAYVDTEYAEDDDTL